MKIPQLSQVCHFYCACLHNTLFLTINFVSESILSRYSSTHCSTVRDERDERRLLDDEGGIASTVQEGIG